MALTPLDSSNLNGYEYDENSRVLIIEFHGGRAYSYFDVPPGVARALGSASSAGKYFHAAIKDQYEFQRGTWRGRATMEVNFPDWLKVLGQ